MRLGFWVVVVLGALGLAGALFAPVVGLVQAFLFFASAWGIRRGRPWAAVAALAMVIAPALAVLSRSMGRIGAGELATRGLLAAIAAALLIRAAITLFRRRGAGVLVGRDWLVAVFVLVFSLTCFSIEPYMVPTSSMANTLLAGDHILVDVVSPALGWTPNRDDLLVLRSPADPARTFFKRVAGVPGDRIHIQDMRVYRNGALVEEPWVIHVTSYTEMYRDNFPDGAPPPVIYPRADAMLTRNVKGGELVVPAGMLFVLGDNRDNSLDSRYFGLVPIQNVVGRPLVIYSSFGRETAAVASGSLPDLRRARWSRMLRRP